MSIYFGFSSRFVLKWDMLLSGLKAVPSSFGTPLSGAILPITNSVCVIPSRRSNSLSATRKCTIHDAILFLHSFHSENKRKEPQTRINARLAALAAPPGARTLDTLIKRYRVQKKSRRALKTSRIKPNEKRTCQVLSDVILW